ncbi:TPA: DUF2213 domain-containing protein [Enterobacter roggenkampii]|uniref:DUF2213 domain-containing protein n=1 Tax=Enterobacter roggenkampii TaxID=1812935 RepID=UPI0003869D2D|nr:DUF2213 domain-containing protein [Enterobacter roggenkampii]CAH5459073.1 hypothetical protein AI2941V1_0230 [Enterobacter cloacae]EPY97136.1 hypothetical protein L799_08995 [Enterobacter roggenkampii EC_38VIM1]MCC7579590.1 DUF2213 domain-containing protein [Enterobacter roggenkampii]MCC7588917.1 DUF2213 domain-containing protein [Enterobacter roggenkampii]MCC7593514.1 DUF2213 domain-containing protein [Enterobacter roggenkampii]
MPVHQKGGKWYWGSKGPFVSKEKAEEVERAAYANGYRGDSYDMGSSVRTYDDYGRMNITQCNISKECVSPYRGSSLPGWRDLGLNPERLYYIYRPAEELIRAADSFNNVPVTIEHPNQLDTPDTPQERVGTTGTDTRFEAPYLVTSMKLWDKAAIEGVENSTRRELSIFPSFFDLDMTPGEFMGQAYDGVARNISGNSVALTIKGRVGAECAVGDSQDQEETLMEGLTDLIKTKFATASDSDADELAKGIMELMAQHEQSEINSGDESEEDEKKGKAAGDESDESDDESTGDEDEEDDKKGKEPMGDSAIRDLVAKAKTEALAEARREFSATREAMRTVEPVYGHVSGDSADDIYKAVLKQEKVNIEGVHPSAYKALVQMAIHSKTSKQPVGDSAEKQASAADFKEYF